MSSFDYDGPTPSNPKEYATNSFASSEDSLIAPSATGIVMEQHHDKYKQRHYIGGETNKTAVIIDTRDFCAVGESNNRTGNPPVKPDSSILLSKCHLSFDEQAEDEPSLLGSSGNDTTGSANYQEVTNINETAWVHHRYKQSAKLLYHIVIIFMVVSLSINSIISGEESINEILSGKGQFRLSNVHQMNESESEVLLHYKPKTARVWVDSASVGTSETNRQVSIHPSRYESSNNTSMSVLPHTKPAVDSNITNLPYALQNISTCNINTKLSDFLVSRQFGWGSRGPPRWIQTMCPQVVRHFSQFPLYEEDLHFENASLPVQTTKYAARSVCTMKVVRLLAASIQARIYLHAGSHLGAILHGQPIPWDDDVDMMMDFTKKDAFMNACEDYAKKSPLLTYPLEVTLHCFEAGNAIKVWLEPEDSKKETQKMIPWSSPFVDLFFFNVESDEIIEVSPKGEKRKVSFTVKEFFPARPYYFGGEYFFGPQALVASKRYKFHNCVMSWYNHRLEAGYKTPRNNCLDCSTLSKVFPFANGVSIHVNGSMRRRLIPTGEEKPLPQVAASIEQRRQWLQLEASDGQKITDELPNLNAVEVDNTISQTENCANQKVHVIAFNAKRGKWWLESVEFLKHADIIILNEMDIGMARSSQQHTTRLLANHLGMNYAWGLEFVELTLGDKQERTSIGAHETNFHGLHGNAILSKCNIQDCKIFRDPVGSYYSDGWEKRLGGRMIMLCHIYINDTKTVVGTTHKLYGSREEIQRYIGSDPAIIAGNQGASFGKDITLNTVIANPKHTTWPASCEKLGSRRDDNIFSNMTVAEEEITLKPCFESVGISVRLSDHAFTSVVLKPKIDVPGGSK